MLEDIDKNNVEVFLRDYQFKKKLSQSYFFLTKTGILYIVGVYFLFKFLGFLVAFFIAALLFFYLLKNNFNYYFYEKEKILVFEKLKKHLGRR